MTLKEKLKTYKQFVETHEKQNDWDSYREKWVADVESLFNLIRQNWLSDFIKNGLATADLIPVKRYEQHLGDYKTNTLEVSFVNNKTIVFEPISSVVLNAEGKIDLYLRGDRMNMIHIFRKIKGSKTTWQILDSRSAAKPGELTKVSIEKLLDKWLQ